MKTNLMKRLDEIAVVLGNKEGAIALIGLGSVGIDTNRLDRYSDIDFFVIVEDGYAPSYLNDLSWLNDAHPLAYTFLNTKDGHKILFEDGIYGEYAVFELSRLKTIDMVDARLHWKNPKRDFILKTSLNPKRKTPTLDFAFNEAMTNIYVGLLRYLRGEYTSALNFVQEYAFNNVISVLSNLEPEQVKGDYYNNARRIETRFPEFSALLPKILVGYKNTPDAAAVLMAFMTTYADLNPRMVKEIELLIESCKK